jgi:hypothetical protein
MYNTFESMTNTYVQKLKIKNVSNCWGPSAYEGPQKQDLTVFLEHNV